MYRARNIAVIMVENFYASTVVNRAVRRAVPRFVLKQFHFFECFLKDPKPEEYQFPDQFPDCNWGCYCPDDKIWSPMHNDCLDGDYDTICNGPVSRDFNA